MRLRTLGVILLVLMALPCRAQSTPLAQLCAPYALYPDALLAQVLAASTFPDQVQAATVWCQENAGLTGSALDASVQAQPWDPSVQALCQFPDVLQKMAQDLDATTQLGQAFMSDSGSVMDCIQNLRAKAQAMGALSSNAQQTVVSNSDLIQIQPANPDTVYVPSYDPSYLYGGTPYPYGAGLLTFGAGVALGTCFNDNYGAFNWANHSMYCGQAVRAGYYGGYNYAGCNTWAHAGGVYGAGAYRAGAYGAYGAAGVAHTGATSVYRGPLGGTDVAHTGTTAFGARGYDGAAGGAFHDSFNAYRPPDAGFGGGGFDSRCASRGFSSMGGYRAGGFSGGFSCGHFGGFRR